MENLALHIEYLLLRHDCVVIPGLGAFINVCIAPSIDEITWMLTPPRHEIRFNAAMRDDDGLLAHSFARKYGVSHREGVEMVAREVSAVVSELNTDGEVTFGRLGVLSLEAEGRLRFYPISSLGKYESQLGYYAVSIRPKAAESADEANSGKFISEPKISEDMRKNVRHLNFEKNYYIPINKSFAKVAACLIVIFTVVFATFNPVNDSRLEDKASVLPINAITPAKEIEKVAAKDIAASEDDVNAESANVKSDITTEEENVVLEAKNEAVYHLIVGTFGNRKMADDYIAQHAGDGYRLQAIESKGLTRVSVMDSDNRQALQSELNTSKFRSQYPGAWIWIH